MNIVASVIEISRRQTVSDALGVENHPPRDSTYTCTEWRHVGIAFHRKKWRYGFEVKVKVNVDLYSALL